MIKSPAGFLAIVTLSLTLSLGAGGAWAQQGESWEVLTKAGTAAYKDRKFGEAEKLIEASMALAEGFAEDDPRLVVTLRNLVAVYRVSIRPARAEAPARRAVALQERNLGPQHPKLAVDLNMLARTLRSVEKYDEAEVALGRAIGIWELVLAPDHPKLRNVLSRMAGLHYIQREYAESVPYYRRALEILIIQRGPEHPSVARDTAHLGFVHFIMGDLAEAEGLYLRALAIREKVLEPNDLDIAESLDRLADLYREQGRRDDAALAYLRGRAIIFSGAYKPSEADIGQRNKKRLVHAQTVAGRYVEQKRYDEAEAIYKQARTVWWAVDPAMLPGMLKDYAALLRAAGRADEAAKLK